MAERILSEETINTFREYLVLEEKSTATVEKYLRDVHAFHLFACQQAVTKERMMAYKKYLIEKGYAASSINSITQSSGAIFITRNGKPLDRSNIWAQMKSLCEAAGVKASKVFPHNLRKLFARTFYGIEKEITKLADILGHSSIDTTRIYIMTAGTEHRRKIERLGLVV